MNENLIKDLFNDEEQISIFKQLIKIPSENGRDNEESVALKIKEILEKEGISSTLKYVDENRPNLYATLEGEKEGKTLLYNGHMDTVPASGDWEHSPFSAFEDQEGYIYGRGSADMKSGVAAMLYAAICLKRMGYPKNGNLILFFNVDEEVSNLGMKQFIEEDFDIDYSIISEPTDLDINIGHKGSARYKLTTRGTAGHAAIIESPDNAIEKMNHFLSVLFQYSKNIRKEKTHELLGSAKSNVTVINAGTAANIIPDECTAIIDRRVLPGETRESTIQDYEELLSKNSHGIEYELEELTFLSSSLIEDDHHLVKTVFEIAQKHKKDAKVKEFEATCEAPFFSVEKGIPTIIYGPGTLEQAHVVNEKVHKSQVIEAGKDFIKIYMTLIED